MQEMLEYPGIYVVAKRRKAEETENKMTQFSFQAE